MPQAIIHNGLVLLNKTYRSHTLDTEEHEKLVYFDDAFDCVTFVEYVVAKSISDLTMEQNSFEIVLQNLRYRNGIIRGYGSRLHYFTEWVLQNCKQYHWHDITKTLGGYPYNKKINYITTHLSKYPNIKATTTLSEIAESEHLINQKQWYFIPKKQVAKIQSKINDGDIIAITTNLNGLDFVHIGFAYWDNGKLYLLHASENEMKVTISNKTLSEYLSHNKNQTGIMVIRCE